MDETDHVMEVIVPDDQLSLAIGKKGQNVRLAAKLTGWKIDIHTETEAKKIALEQATEDVEIQVAHQNEISAGTGDISAPPAEEAAAAADSGNISSLPGVGPKTRDILKDAGINSMADIVNAGMDGLSAIEGIGPKKAKKLIEAAKERNK